MSDDTTEEREPKSDKQSRLEHRTALLVTARMLRGLGYKDVSELCAIASRLLEREDDGLPKLEFVEWAIGRFAFALRDDSPFAADVLDKARMDPRITISAGDEGITSIGMDLESFDEFVRFVAAIGVTPVTSVLHQTALPLSNAVLDDYWEKGGQR